MECTKPPQVLPSTTALERQAPRHAVIICTYNRPEDLRRTLRSITAQDVDEAFVIVVVDASPSPEGPNGQQLADNLKRFSLIYLSYQKTRSTARQRNWGLDHLPDSVEYVHLIDDDVTLLPDYFHHLTCIFNNQPDVGGVGGLVLNSEGNVPKIRKRARWLKRLFLQTSDQHGRVLVSGHCSPTQTCRANTPFPTQWLNSGASVFRRSLLEHVRFDEALEGYAMKEDLDLSYRISKRARLIVEPKARIIHHRSPLNRHSPARYAERALLNRYWFVEKNIEHPLRKLAFWWATLGRALALLTSKKPRAHAAWRGLRRGIRTIWTRDHPLLQSY